MYFSALSISLEVSTFRQLQNVEASGSIAAGLRRGAGSRADCRASLQASSVRLCEDP